MLGAIVLVDLDFVVNCTTQQRESRDPKEILTEVESSRTAESRHATDSPGFHLVCLGLLQRIAIITAELISVASGAPMSWRILDKLIALLLVGQLLVLPAVLASHQHDHVMLEAHDGLHVGHSHCHHHHHHHANEGRCGTEDPPPAHHSHDDCRICQFLAQAAMPPVLTVTDALFAPVESLSCRELVVAAAPLVSLPHSRAPPVSA